MVMEVIPEDLNVGDVFVAALRGQVTGEENCITVSTCDSWAETGWITESDVAGLALAAIFQARDTGQFKRRVVSEKDLRGILQSQGAASGVDKLLEEYLAEDTICLFTEDCAEDHCDSVMAGFDVDSFLLPIVDCHNFSALLNTLRGRLCAVF